MSGCRALSNEELRRIFEREARTWTEARNCGLLALGCTTGYRISELLSLSRRDVLTPDGRLRMKVRVAGKHMKSGKARTVPLSAELLGPFIRWLEVQQGAGGAGKDTPLFPSRKGGGERALSRQGAWRSMKAVCLAAGVDETEVGTHSMRKTLALQTYLYGLQLMRAGHQVDPMRLVQKVLGHADIRATEHYMKDILQSEVAEAFLAAGRAIASAWTGMATAVAAAG